MALPLENLDLHEITTDGFFNEGEAAILATIQSSGSGVYKLTQDKQSQFIAAELVSSVAEDDAIVENGRIVIIGETQDFMYVRFAV
jgi:hypothetical protein